MKETRDMFQSYRNEIIKEAKTVSEKAQREAKEREYISYDDYVLSSIKGKISEISGGELQVDFPPEQVNADLSISTFDLAKKLKVNPADLAKKISNAIDSGQIDEIEKSEFQGAYVNLTLNKPKVYGKSLKQIGDLGSKYGESDVNKGKIGVIDFSSPNIAKPIGVGHLRSTIIGNSLYKIYKSTGYEMIRDNHLGDWGTQFGKLVLAFNKWGNVKDLEKDPIQILKNLYVQFHQEAEKDPKLEDEAREVFKKLENGDHEVVDLWKKFSDLSVREFERIYKKLGVEFDLQIGEGFYADQSGEVISDCVKSGACKEESSEGLVVCEISDLPSFLLRKEDGSSLYATRDLATIKFREEQFSPDAIIYVVGDEQGLYFKQVFALAKKVGYTKESTQLNHVGFGMVLGEDGKKMSTRKGSLIELEDLINRSQEESMKILAERYPDSNKKELEEIAEILGISAIIFNDLKHSRESNISFNWERMLDYKGGSAVYLQYSSVRINSILEKVKEEKGKTEPFFNNVIFEKEEEFELLKRLMFFPEVILRAQKNDYPHFIRLYLEDVVEKFNKFYDNVSVIKTEEKDLFSSRLMLISATQTVLKKGLDLLGVKVPSRL